MPCHEARYQQPRGPHSQARLFKQVHPQLCLTEYRYNNMRSAVSQTNNASSVAMQLLTEQPHLAYEYKAQI
jgi:hypothetical protein